MDVTQSHTESKKQVLIDADAGRKAFRASQLFETLLMDQAAEIAIRLGLQTITKDIVEKSLEKILSDQLLREMREEPNGDTGECQNLVA
ncbi:MAG: hypothetical protein Tsb009_12270 [Planctomycetaceae bacterium]